MTIIIAEAGVNHNGSLDIAKTLIDYAVDAGADIVKFQTFKADQLCSRHLPLAEYQSNNITGVNSQLEMLRRLELSEDMHFELLEYCKSKHIEFLSTPFGAESVKFLTKLPVKRWKIPSGEIDNVQLLKAVATTNKPIILSTGMANLDDIEFAINTINSFSSGFSEISLLHCTTEYPAPFSEINLMSIPFMRERFNLPIGYSDHTEGIEASVAACALGANIIEKHFTLDKTMEGPDHKASIEPVELKKLVDSVRNITISLGESKKEVANIERKNIQKVKKFIVALRDIGKDEKFNEENIGLRRTGGGIPAKYFYDIVDTTVGKDYSSGEIIDPSLFNQTDS